MLPPEELKALNSAQLQAAANIGAAIKTLRTARENLASGLINVAVADPNTFSRYPVSKQSIIDMLAAEERLLTRQLADLGIELSEAA